MAQRQAWFFDGRQFQRVTRVTLPVLLHDPRQAQNHDIEEAANQQAENRDGDNKQSWTGLQPFEQGHGKRRNSLDRLAELEDRQIHRDDQAADEHAEYRSEEQNSERK